MSEPASVKQSAKEQGEQLMVDDPRTQGQRRGNMVLPGLSTSRRMTYTSAWRCCLQDKHAQERRQRTRHDDGTRGERGWEAETQCRSTTRGRPTLQLLDLARRLVAPLCQRKHTGIEALSNDVRT